MEVDQWFMVTIIVKELICRLQDSLTNFLAHILSFFFDIKGPSIFLFRRPETIVQYELCSRFDYNCLNNKYKLNNTLNLGKCETTDYKSHK